ncbi:hypothetical protein BS78_04G305400 [Paspalum vaginatum]|nr:hypothetical protein BS78_04G305400 [Paspalum vaginatum]
MKRRGVVGAGGDDDGTCCPPHPAFIRGFCFLCGAKEEDTEGRAPGVAVGQHDTMKQGGDDHDDDDDSSRCPPHPAFVGGLCSKCGAKEDAGGSASTKLAAGRIHGGPVLPASTTTNVPRAPDRATLLRTKKLVLILDLDHTLLNSTTLDDFSAIEQEKGFTTSTAKDDPSLELFRVEPNGIPVLTKLRPFARGLLEEASTMFEMYGGVRLLDPDGVYFGERIVSSQESSRPHMKNLDVIPGAEEATVVIIDDMSIAWPWHQDNLILIDRYLYFASACRNFGCQNDSLAERGLDEREHDGPLAVVLSVLKRIHKGFFDSVGDDKDDRRADVQDVITEVRNQVLRGCTVVFSLSESLRGGDESETPIWDLAEQLGAVCLSDVGETVTHVVAEDPDTEKAQWARDNNKFLVDLEWINAASFRWCRQDETALPVRKR